MTTMLIANNCTRESGSFCGDQLCSLKTAYLFVENCPGVDRVIMSVSPKNEMHFLWTKFVEKHNVQLVRDDWHPGDWSARHGAWDRWRAERKVTMDDGSVVEFQHYRELYLRIHGAMRQQQICGEERGLNRRNIYEYWLAGQEDRPNEFPGADWFDDTLVHHPPRRPERDVYISPMAKTQGNHVFTIDPGFWADVVERLVDEDVMVTVGYDGYFRPDLDGHPNFRRHWGSHEEWMAQVCSHKIVACGNTGTGWLAAACGTPMITVEPHNSCMADHRYRECGLRNIVEVVDGAKLDDLNRDMVRAAEYVARRIIEQVKRCVVLTTGCYDVLHAGHVRHLQAARAMGTRLVVALNSDASVRALKGPDRPICPQHQRKAVLEALRCVDEVRIFDGLDALPLIQEIRPHFIACGFGYGPDDIVGRDVVGGWGGRAVVTYRGDAKDEPSTTKIVRRARMSDVRGAIRAGAPYSVNPEAKLTLMANEFLRVAHLPGVVADLGTCRGGTALILRRLAPDKELHCFDTWEGTPHDDPLCHHKRGEWAASFDDCRKLVCNVAGCGPTHWHRGVFPKVVELADDSDKFCFVYADTDTYQSTRDAIAFFWPRMVTGGVMFFDDYGWEPCAGVVKAVDEVFNERSVLAGDLTKRIVQQLYTCIVEKR